MVRDIKFRGYSKLLNQWIYGYYVKHIDETFNPFGKTEKEREEWFKEHTKHYIVDDGFSDWNMPRGLEFFKVEENSIGQFAGIQDCNGKDIYEGDIIKYKDEICYIDFVLRQFNIITKEENHCLYEEIMNDERIEIIDNIYEMGRGKEFKAD